MGWDKLLMPFYRDGQGNWQSEGYEGWEPTEPPPFSTRVTIILGVGNIVLEAFKALESMGYPLPFPDLLPPPETRYVLAELKSLRLREERLPLTSHRSGERPCPT
jgi:hypothetical protein